MIAQSTALQQQQQQIALFAQLQQQQQQAQAAVVSSAPVAMMTSMPSMSAGVLDQWRQQQQFYAMAGATAQATAFETLIRQYQAHQQQQVESMHAATQQQQVCFLSIYYRLNFAGTKFALLVFINYRW